MISPNDYQPSMDWDQKTILELRQSGALTEQQSLQLRALAEHIDGYRQLLASA